jgi:hypothetical protein
MQLRYVFRSRGAVNLSVNKAGRFRKEPPRRFYERRVTLSSGGYGEL